VPYIGKPLRIDIRTCQQQIHSAAQIYDRLNLDLAVDLRLIENGPAFCARAGADPTGSQESAKPRRLSRKLSLPE
jgi:hypothetical protein